MPAAQLTRVPTNINGINQRNMLNCWTNI
jgi:hypothetical protein